MEFQTKETAITPPDNKVEQETSKVSLDELKRFRDSIKNKVDGVLENEPESIQAQIMIDNIWHDFFQAMEDIKEDFAQIFDTEGGDKYFVIESGQVMKFETDSSRGFEAKPLYEKGFFVSEKFSEELKKDRDEGTGRPFEIVADKEVKTEKIKKGVVPVSFGLEDFPTVTFAEGEGFIKIDSKTSDRLVGPGVGFQIGEPVEKIIKG